MTQQSELYFDTFHCKTKNENKKMKIFITASNEDLLSWTSMKYLCVELWNETIWTLFSLNYPNDWHGAR